MLNLNKLVLTNGLEINVTDTYVGINAISYKIEVFLATCQENGLIALQDLVPLLPASTMHNFTFDKPEGTYKHLASVHLDKNNTYRMANGLVELQFTYLAVIDNQLKVMVSYFSEDKIPRVLEVSKFLDSLVIPTYSRHVPLNVLIDECWEVIYDLGLKYLPSIIYGIEDETKFTFVFSYLPHGEDNLVELGEQTTVALGKAGFSVSTFIDTGSYYEVCIKLAKASKKDITTYSLDIKNNYYSK